MSVTPLGPRESPIYVSAGSRSVVSVTPLGPRESPIYMSSGIVGRFTPCSLTVGGGECHKNLWLTISSCVSISIRQD